MSRHADVVELIIGGAVVAVARRCAVVAVDGHLDVVDVRGDARFPCIGTDLAVDGHDAISAAGDVGAKRQRPGYLGVVIAVQIVLRAGEQDVQPVVALIQRPAVVKADRLGIVVQEVGELRQGEVLLERRAVAVDGLQLDVLVGDFEHVSLVAGLDAQDHGLAVNVAIGALSTTGALLVGIEHVEQEISVTVAVPAPVDVEQAVAGVAVAHKRVAAAGLAAAVHDGASCGQLLIEHVFPRAGGIMHSSHILGTVLIAEVVDHGDGDVAGIGAR